MIFSTLLKCLCFTFCFSTVVTLTLLKHYKLNLMSLEKCKLPASRIDQSVSPNVTFYMSARKINRETSLIRFNFTIGEGVGSLYFSFRCYQIKENTVRDLVFNIEKLNCNNPIIQGFINGLSLKFDSSCYAIPGFYKVDKLDINEFASLLTTVIIGPGKYAYDLDFVTNKGTVACISFSCDIRPIK